MFKVSLRSIRRGLRLVALHSKHDDRKYAFCYNTYVAITSALVAAVVIANDKVRFHSLIKF